MVKCNFCGKEFEPTPYKKRQNEKGIPVYCSKSCATSFRYKDKLNITDELINKVKYLFSNTDLPYDEIQKMSGLSKDRFTKMIKLNNIGRTKEQSDKLRVRHLKDTMIEKYGVTNSMEVLTFKNKIKQTKLERYSNENYNNLEQIKQTKLERYNNENYNNNNQTKQTNLKKYGVVTPLQTNETKEKVKQTNLEKYGVDNAFKAVETHNKAKQVIKEKYGVNSVLQLSEIQNKIKDTNLKRYGATNVFKNKDIKQKQFDTIKEKYGVNYACQLEQCANSSPKTHSHPNEKWKKLLNPDKVEIPLDTYRYDMLKHNVLIEIDPTYTHNSYTSPFRTS